MLLLRRLVAMGLLVVTACSAAGGETASARVDVTFVPDGAVVRFDRPTRVRRIEITSPATGFAAAFRLVETLPDRPVVRHRLFFEPADRDYVLTVVLRGGEAPLVVGGRPGADVLVPVSLVLQVPYIGDEDVTQRWRPSAGRSRPFVGSPGAAFTVESELVAWTQPVEGELTFVVGRHLRAVGDLSGWTLWRDDAGRTMLRRRVPLHTPMRVRQFTLALEVIGVDGDASSVAARFVPDPVGTGPSVLERSAPVRVVSPGRMQGMIGVERVVMPTDARGERDVRRPVDTVVLPSRAGTALRRLLGASAAFHDYDAPFTWLALALRNRSDAPLSLVVSVQVTDLERDEPVSAFRPPGYLCPPGAPLVVDARLEPGESAALPLPVYLRTDRILPGHYRAVIGVSVFGTDQQLARVEHVFEVRATDVRALVVTALSVVVSVGALVFFLARQRRIFAAFRVSELVLIALFATMTFVLVIFPGSILGPLFSAVAGPFAFLIQGIFFEVLRVLVLVTLLVLVPRVGTVTLVSLVRYLIGG
ncbi:MAG TPA: hypothetical protein VMY39_10135, partial [Planctomycetota bacterium]|nr:hypothetical protein [Planctomycetota bacterium]